MLLEQVSTGVGHTSLSNARVWSGERSSCQFDSKLRKGAWSRGGPHRCHPCHPSHEGTHAIPVDGVEELSLLSTR